MQISSNFQGKSVERSSEFAFAEQSHDESSLTQNPQPQGVANLEEMQEDIEAHYHPHVIQAMESVVVARQTRIGDELLY